MNKQTVYVPTHENLKDGWVNLPNEPKVFVKKQENVFVLTEHEIKELLSKTFDAGFNYSGECFIDHLIEISNPYPNKEQYIKQLNID